MDTNKMSAVIASTLCEQGRSSAVQLSGPTFVKAENKKGCLGKNGIDKDY